MKTLTMIMFVVIIGIVVGWVALGTTELNSLSYTTQINATNMSGYDKIQNINPIPK